MFIRFVVHARDSDSQERQGIFQATGDLRDTGKLSDAERAWADAAFAWFNEHLPRPQSFTGSKRHNARARAVSWFRSTAREHLRQAQSLVALLEQQGVAVERLETDRPGYVVYEDEFQVVALPFESTRRGR